MFNVLRRLFRLPERFAKRHFERREKYRPDYDLLRGSLLELMDFESVMDIGCANGFLLEGFDAAGKRVGGVELSPEVLDLLPKALGAKVTIGDFSEAAGDWDLVSCVEVAEHVPPGRSIDLVDTVTRLAGRWIYFTAAPPGQKGRGHVNCRPHDDWLGWFDERGWKLDEERTQDLRRRLEDLPTCHWLRGNSMILRPA
jgi:SAM-dependent methyltransferase